MHHAKIKNHCVAENATKIGVLASAATVNDRTIHSPIARLIPKVLGRVLTCIWTCVEKIWEGGIASNCEKVWEKNKKNET